MDTVLPSSSSELSPEVERIAFALAKIILALGIIGIIIWYTPILDLLYASIYLIFIPLAFLVAIGVVNKNTILLISVSWKEVKKRAKYYKETLEEKREK